MYFLFTNKHLFASQDAKSPQFRGQLDDPQQDNDEISHNITNSQLPLICIPSAYSNQIVPYDIHSFDCWDDGNLNIDHFFFLSTPTVFPLLPVVLVCCPRTFSPHLCLRPRLLLILKSLSTSSLSLVSRTLEATCRFFPSLQSFCLLRNHRGTP